MKNPLGFTFKKALALTCFVLIFACAKAAFCYETIILHFPDRDWLPVSYERKVEEEEVIAKFVPRYDDKENWVEMLVFHSYKWAKKSNETSDAFIETLVDNNRDKFGNITKKVIKTDPLDSIVTWCAQKGTGKEPAQCEILRVTNGVESVMSIQYITRDVENFEQRSKIWIPVLQNAVVYYSYFRWNRMLNKALCVEL